MRRLVAAAGGPTEWVRRYGGTRWTQAQVSQWISDTKPKGIGGNLARDLEGVMGLAHGDLDRPGSAEVAPTSQPARLDPATVRATHELLRGAYADAGKEYDIEAEPDLFVIVYERLAGLARQPTLAEVVSIGRAIGERQQGAVKGGEEGSERSGVAHSGKGKKRATG